MSEYGDLLLEWHMNLTWNHDLGWLEHVEYIWLIVW